MSDHVVLEFREAICMKGDAWVLASEAMKKRSRAEELDREVHQLLADAEALERGARSLAATVGLETKE